MVAIVGGLLFLATGTFLIVLASSAIVKPPQGREILTALFVGGIVGTMCCTGAYLVWAFLRRHRTVVEIGPEGVQYGAKHISWDRVRRIAGIYHRQRFQLKLVRRGFASDLHLSTDEGLSEKEYTRLLSTLKRDLQGRYPDMSIG